MYEDLTLAICSTTERVLENNSQTTPRYSFRHIVDYIDDFHCDTLILSCGRVSGSPDYVFVWMLEPGDVSSCP